MSVLEQLHEKIGGQIEIGLLVDQMIRDEVRQGRSRAGALPAKVAAVAREGCQRHEQRQRQFVLLAFLGRFRFAFLVEGSASSKDRDASARVQIAH